MAKIVLETRNLHQANWRFPSRHMLLMGTLEIFIAHWGGQVTGPTESTFFCFKINTLLFLGERQINN